jgi:hypothetical protein
MTLPNRTTLHWGDSPFLTCSGLSLRHRIPNPLEPTTMRRVITPVMLALAFAAFTSANASAGLFGKLCSSGCDTACCAEPACGCEAPACGCEVAAPSCGCESACGHGCKRPHLLARLFAKRHAASCCAEPACGAEEACCAEPACGCEVASGCDSGCHSGCGIKRPGLLSKLFGKIHGGCCDSGCAAPACGCEPTCGF